MVHTGLGRPSLSSSIHRHIKNKVPTSETPVRLGQRATTTSPGGTLTGSHVGVRTTLWEKSPVHDGRAVRQRVPTTPTGGQVPRSVPSQTREGVRSRKYLSSVGKSRTCLPPTRPTWVSTWVEKVRGRSRDGSDGWSSDSGEKLTESGLPRVWGGCGPFSHQNFDLSGNTQERRDGATPPNHNSRRHRKILV